MSVDELKQLLKTVQSFPNCRTKDEWEQTKFKQVNAYVLLLLLIDNNIDHGFNFKKQPEIHVAPPKGAGVPAGVFPAAIKDPVLRSKYEADIEANKKYCEIYNREVELQILFKSTFRACELLVESSFDISELDKVLAMTESTVPKSELLDQIRLRFTNAVKRKHP